MDMRSDSDLAWDMEGALALAMEFLSPLSPRLSDMRAWRRKLMEEELSCCCCWSWGDCDWL